MRWIIVVTTTVLLATRVAAADPAGSGSWWTRWWPFGKASGQKKTEAPPAKAEARQSGGEPLRAREKAEYLRRVAVCDRLRLFAVEANDEELSRKADQLEQRAWDVYRQRTANPSGRDVGLEERLLDRHLGVDPRLPMRDLGAGSTSRGLGQGRAMQEVER